MSQRIHVVEDHDGIQELLRVNLSMAGYAVLQSRTGSEAWPLLAAGAAELVVLDWNLPDDSGLSLLRRLRQAPAHAEVPVLFLTARDAEADKIRAFEAGADGYMTKPFNTRELIARVQSLLRRAARQADGPASVEVDGLRIDPRAASASLDGKPLPLRTTECRLLYALVRQPAHVHTREQLLELAWPGGAELGERAVDACVARLRQHLQAAGHHPCIETVRSIGYRFVPRDASAIHG